VSIRAADYVLQWLEDDDELTTSARLVLMLLAARANSQTGVTYTGEWLQDVTGLGRSALWRAMGQIRDSGIVAVDDRHRSGSRVRFPVVSKLSTVVAPARRLSPNHPSVSVALARHGVAPGARVSGSISGIENARDTHDSACACDSTGWVYNDETRTVSPCPSHAARCRAGGS